MSLVRSSDDSNRSISTTSEADRLSEQIERNQEAIALLDSWAFASEAEIQEQKETWEFLKRALDEDRLSYRKLFP